MPKFQVAVILTVEAESFDQAAEWAEMKLDQTVWTPSLTYEIPCFFDHDGSLANQRVIYLHDESEPYTP